LAIACAFFTTCCWYWVEGRFQRFLEGHCLGRDHVHQRSALDAGEDDRLQLLLDLFVGLAHDDAAARAAQGLVCGGGDHVRMRHRVRIHARGNEAGNVRHVHEQVGTDLVGDGAEARPVDDLRVGAEKPATTIFGLCSSARRSTSS
jgi:hypothetical protein